MRRILLLMMVAMVVGAMMAVGALPALAATTGDANQGPPEGSGGLRFQTKAAETHASTNAQNDENAASVLHCGGMSPFTEGARVTKGGTTGTEIGPTECQTPDRNENGSPIGHL